MIRIMILQKGGTIEDASDIFQDGLIIILEKLDNKQFALACKFVTFLYSVCDNLWKKVLEKREVAANYFATRNESEGNPDLTDLIDQKMYEEIFHKVFETLEPVKKEILTFYWRGLSPQEIANKLGVSNGYVRKAKCEAQNELTEKVKRLPEYMRLKRTERAAREVVH